MGDNEYMETKTPANRKGKNMNTTIHRDLARLHKTMMRMHRIAEDHHDPEISKTYEKDIDSLSIVARMVRRGQLAHAGNYAHNLDTEVHDYIPVRLYNTITKAAGISGLTQQAVRPGRR